MSIATEAPAPLRVVRREGGWRAALSLSRVEGPRLMLHPLVLGFTVIMILPTLIWWGDATASLTEIAISAGILVWPLAGAVLIASNLAVRRPRRDDTAEVFDAAPLSDHARTAGHLIAVIWPTIFAAVVTGVLVGLEAARGVGGPLPLADLATAPILVAGAGALGVLTARWLPGLLGWALGLVAVLFIETGISSIQPEASRLRWLAPWVSTDQYLPADLVVRDASWHALYLVGLIAVISVLAMTRSGMTKPVAIAAVASVLAASTGAIAQTRQLSAGEAATLASRTLAAPPCVELERVRYCVNDPGSIERWTELVQGVLEVVPDRVARRGLVVRQRPGGLTLRALPLEARSLFPPGVPIAAPWVWPDDGTVQIDTRGRSGLDGPDEMALTLMLKTASWSVGLPLEPGSFVPTAAEAGRVVQHSDRIRALGPATAGRPAMLPCTAAGQSRAVVALWLAAQAHPSIGQYLREAGAPGNEMIDDGVSHRHGIDAIPIDHDELLMIEPVLWTADMPSPVLWGSSDLRYAMQLLQRPVADVTAAVGASWDELTDPRTPTSTLVRTLNIEPLTASQTTLPYEPVEPPCR